ncbi:hypothetical protein D3M71_06815, partial [Erwinia billingiae]|nr:hypothetical protein [Erwinia billingiae]
MFSPDNEQQMSEVHFERHPEFSRVEYRYNVLGRRTYKILHRHGKEAETVSFLWSGLRMVVESSSLRATCSICTAKEAGSRW